jgi:hypothetical protein
MSRNDVIAANSRRVVGNYSESSGTPFQARRLTSDYGVEPRAYSDFFSFFGLLSSGGNSEAYNPDRSAHTITYTARLRTADDSPTPALKQGDQVLDADGILWAVMGAPTSGPGTIAYSLERQGPLLADGDRKGGV